MFPPRSDESIKLEPFKPDVKWWVWWCEARADAWFSYACDQVNLTEPSELAKHHARGSLLRFLVDPSVSPTNNSAERALRPAVIARKLSVGSKTVSGATVFSAFKSVIETGKLAGVDGFNTLLDLYANPR